MMGGTLATVYLSVASLQRSCAVQLVDNFDVGWYVSLLFDARHLRPWIFRVSLCQLAGFGGCLFLSKVMLTGDMVAWGPLWALGSVGR